MVEEKLAKAIQYIEKAMKHYKEGNKPISKGELDFAREYIEESSYLILAELEDDKEIHFVD